MDELDRELGALADSLRPTRQPPLDELVARSVRRRRRTAAATSALAVLAVTGAAAVALAGDGGTTVTPPVATQPPTTTPTPASTRAPVGCGHDRVQGIVDYINFVKVGDLVMASADTYGIPVTVREADLGQATTRVSCSLEEETGGTGSTEHMDDGTASFLPMGTTVSEVRGFDPRCRVAAVFNGKLTAFLASIPDAKTHQVAPCAVMPGLDPDAPDGSPGDYRSAPPAFRDRAKLPDCGSYTFSDKVQSWMQAPMDCFEEAVRSNRPAELRIAVYGSSGSVAFVVMRTESGLIEMWRSDRAADSDDVRWVRSRCVSVGPSGGANCSPYRVN